MAGGFFAGTPGGSQATPSEKKVLRIQQVNGHDMLFVSLLLFLQSGAQRAQNVMPVNIADIINSPDEKLKIEDNDVHMVYPLQ